MTVSITLVVIMAVLFACGVYAMLERSLTRVLLGFLLLGNAANLLLLMAAGPPGVAPFFDAEAGDQPITDPLPQALTLTAIVITFAISAFLLALIYRSWQLGQADLVEDDLEDVALRERPLEPDETTLGDDEDPNATDAPTDFVEEGSSPITVLHHRDLSFLRDDAPTDAPARRRTEVPEPADERAADDRPADERPAEDRPEDDRPGGERP